MKTAGTFQDVYSAAREYNNGQSGCPMNPVVRKYADKWALESGLNSAEGAELECTLDAFDSWFFDCYKNDAFIPSASDESDFAKSITPDPEW